MQAITIKGDTALHEASRAGHAEAAKVTYFEWHTVSGYSSHIQMFQVLVADLQMNVDVRNAISSTPLHVAAGQGHLSVVEVSLSQLVSKLRLECVGACYSWGMHLCN